MYFSMHVKTDSSAPRSQLVVAIELLEALNQSSGGCEQMCFQRRDPRFLLMRDGLQAAKMFVISTLPKSIRRGEREKKVFMV